MRFLSPGELCYGLQILILFVAIFGVQAKDDVKIERIDPRYGGRGGAVKITAYGENFDVELDWESKEPRTKMYLVSNERQYECDFSPVESNKRQAVCYTRPMEWGRYYLRMKVVDKWLEQKQYCRGSWNNYYCTYNTNYNAYTPTINNLDRVSATPHSLITIDGYVVTDKVDSSTETASNGKTEELQRVWLTSGECSLYQHVDKLYGVEVSSSGYGTIKCNISSSYVGNQNVSFIVGGTYGQSVADIDTRYLSADNHIYMLQTYAVVEDVYPKMASVTGGVRMKIKGKFFDDRSGIKAKVLIGGSNCKVESVTDNEIICVVGEKPNEMEVVYPGGRGAKIEMLANNIGNFNDTDSDDYLQHFSDSVNICTGNRLTSRSTGFFIPSVTGNYKFYFSNPKTNEKCRSCKLYMQTNFSSGLELITERGISSPQALEKGTNYYYEADIAANSGCDPSMKLNAEVDETKYTSEQLGSVFGGRQNIYVTSSVVNEEQLIETKLWENQDSMNTELNLTLSCNVSFSGQKFRISVGGMKTDWMNYDVGQEMMSTNVEELDVFTSEESVVAIKSMREDNSTNYHITIQSGRGDFFPYVKVETTPLLNGKLTSLVAGSPDYKTLTFEHGGFLSKPISIDSTEEEMRDAVVEIFSPKCPKNLYRESLMSKVFKFYDMETPDTTPRSGGSRTIGDSFCGAYSAKNLNYAYYDQDDPIRLNNYKYFCFAYVGGMKDDIYVDMEYKENSATKKVWNSVKLDGLVITSSWKYLCYNLDDVMKSRYPDGRDFRIFKILFQRYNTTFVDDIYFGADVPDMMEIQGYLDRRILPAVSHIKIKQVDISKSNENSSRILMKSDNCEQNYPLLGFAFLGKREIISESETLHGAGRNFSQIHVTRIASASPPIGGTFNINFENGEFESIPNVPANITREELQTLIEGIDGLYNAYVYSFAPYCYSYRWGIRYENPTGKVFNMIINGTNLTGTDPRGEQNVIQVGGMKMEPIPGDHLRTAHSKPQVQVYINNIPSTCAGDFDDNPSTSCGFEWSESMVASVDTVTPTAGSESSTIVITGSGFDDSVVTNNEVLIGDVRCNVSSASQTRISCVIGKSPVGEHQPLIVRIIGKGYAQMANHTKTFTVNASIDSVTPSSGSVAGCNEITIAGSGFDDSITSVELGEVACDVISVTYDEITCVSGSTTAAGGGVVDVTVKYENGVEVDAPGRFEFLSSSSAGEIASLSSRTLRVAGGENLTLSGSRLGSNGTVTIGGVEVSVVSWKDDEIIIKTPSLAPASYQLQVKITGQGCALNLNGTSMNYDFSITSISPSSGSLLGGTQVTINGSGLNDDVVMMIGESPCGVIRSNDVSLVCMTSSTTTLHRVDNMGSHKTYGIGYRWKPAVLQIMLGDEVNFRWATPESVEGINIGPFTCSSPISEVYDEDGFIVPPTPSGSFTYRFTKTGTFYYKSIVKADIIMTGRVIVSDRTQILSTISASIGQHKAIDSESLRFTSSLDHTPLVHSISPNLMNIHTELELNTTKLLATPNIMLGGRTCAITARTNTSVKCRISVEEMLPVGRHDVGVTVPAIGDAMLAINKLEDRSIVFYPTLDNISPISGSLEGSTLLTIGGSGFTTSTKVLIGSYLNCDIQDATYNAIKCWTPKHSFNETFDVNILESGVRPNNSGVFTFSYLAERTPLVSNITMSTNQIHYNLTITGTGFGSNFSSVTVGVGGSKCLVIAHTFNDGQFSCEIVEQLPVGENQITVHVGGKGSASISPSTTNLVLSEAVIFSVNPLEGSLQGGTKVTITGNGFVEGKTMVIIGGGNCDITSVKVGSITCVTKPSPSSSSSSSSSASYDVEVTSNNTNYPRKFIYSYTTSNTPTISGVSPSEAYQGQTIILEGSQFGNQSNLVSITSANNGSSSLCAITSINDTQIACILDTFEGGPVDIQMHVEGKGLAKFDSAFTYLLSIDSISPTSGSYGGHQEVTINGQGFSSRSMVTIGGKKCEIINQKSTQITCYTPSLYNITVAAQQAEVQVMNGDVSSSSETYNYLLNQTALVRGVSPNMGGTGGGTSVTITGTNFHLSGSSDPVVKIGGIECKVHDHNDTTILCETEPRPSGSIETQVEVYIGDYGIARQDDAYFYYIDRWSSRFTWGGSDIPTTKDFVVIPKGKTVLLDTHTEVLVMLVIDGGKLIFDDTQDVSLHAENILITSGGVLQVGTEERPYGANAEIVLHGHVKSPELPIYGAKTLAVREGLLDLHGRHIPITWTKLSETVHTGSAEIKIHHSVNWRINDEIVIATTGSRHSQEQNEKRKINAISSDGKTITLDRALEFEHLGVEETLGNRTVEFKAEVGLLSRNIVIRGSDDPQWHDEIAACEQGFNPGAFATQTCFQGRFGEEIGSDQFGGTIMIHARNASSLEAIAKIEYVEMTYMGQAFRLRRYPIHWHMMGDVHGSYLKGCSIHNTFNRAVAIHGTNNLLVDGNVIYDVMGSAFFLEEGTETGNVIQYNLAIFVKQSTSLLNVDITPAAYWVTNPNNTLIHNHAAGGTHFGFWYRLIRSQNTQLGRFENNTVHSQGRIGLWIYPRYTPPSHAPARFNSLTTWNSEKGAEWVYGGAVQFHDFVMVNNDVTGMEMKMIVGTTGYGDDGHMVKGGLIAGHSTISDPAFETSVGITLPFSPGLTVEGVNFHNFNRRGVAFKITTITGKCTHLCGGYYYIMKGLSFNNVVRKMHWRWEHEGVLQDEDGTLTGFPKHRVVPISGILNSSLCQDIPGDAFSSGAVNSLLCPPSVRFHRFALNGITPSSLTGKDMIITSTHGSSVIPYAIKRLTHPYGWMALLYGGDIHTVEWNNSYKFTNISYKSIFYDLHQDDYVFVRHTLAAAPDVIEINSIGGNVTDSSAINSTSDNLQWHFDQNTRNWDYIVANHNPGVKQIGVSPKIYRNAEMQKCRNVGCVPDLDLDQLPPMREIPRYAYTFTWSSLGLGATPTNQSSNHPCVVLKDNSSTVEILQASLGIELCWCIIDVPIINIRNIIIKGVVHFSNDVEFETFNFSANTIQVLGGRIIAGFLPEDPFTKKLEINLKGKPADGNEVAYRDVNLGTKALGCFGGCDFHGISHNIYWTYLSQTAEAGSTTLRLTEAVDWTAGDEIVITTTSYSSAQTEKRIITSVSEGSQITVDSPLEHRHLANSYTINNQTFEMRAEVGLLSRNIKIQGEIYDGIEDDEFGARVLVGYLSSADIYGWARISNVEFVRGGQEGFIDSYDPRFALAWLDTGLVIPARPSFVRNSAFHDCYSTGIGVFGADGIEVKNNIVHRPLHDGIRIGGNNIRVERNLVANSVSRGHWHASFKLTEGTNIMLMDNVAAGSQHICFYTNGVECGGPSSLEKWKGNVAHGCLHGVHMMSSRWKCSMLENFVIYQARNYGVYHQTSSNVIIRNMVIADAQIGYVPIIFGPPSSTHQYADKMATVENLLLIGRSDDYDETSDLPAMTHGKIGILLPMFQSYSNGAPRRSFLANTNYPTIGGLLNITGITVYNYKKISSNQRDVVFHTNSENEDAYVPTYVTNVTRIQVEDDSLVLYQRPSISLINPSDCVDMECDGMKNVLIKDTDGSLLGAPGSIIPDAAYGWDDDSMKERGLGDYRIPKTLLTGSDGRRIEVNSIIDHRGIAGTSNCTYMDAWQAYDCHGENVLDYTMMVMESMDADTETRRLSPVAFMANRYVDLQNGPQDHGWCSGYTCQKRLSTFFTLVAMSTHYDVYFTGYPPLDLRIHFLNVDHSQTIRIGIYYPKPERLDVYNGDVYIHPLNQALNDEGKLVTKAPRPDQPDEYKPAINESVHGSNYMDRRNDILYVTIRGSGPIDIRTAPAVIVKFGFPAVSIDEFFEENLIFNLASYLGVPAHKIKIVDIVRESARKRRSLSKPSTEIVEYVFEFDDGIVGDEAPSGGIGNKTLAAEKINSKTDEMIKDFQVGSLASMLNVTWMELDATVASMELPPQFLNETKEVETKILIPTKQNSTILSTLFEELSDVPQPSLTLLDNTDLPVHRLGGEWKAQLVLIPQIGVTAQLLGSPMVHFTDGAAVFQGLGISNAGTHTIQFKVVEPAAIYIPPTNITVEVIARQIRAIFLQQFNTLLPKNESLTFSLRLTDKNGANLNHIGYKGNQWKARVELADEFASVNTTVVDGESEFLFDNRTGETGTDGLMLTDSKDYYRYMFKVTIYSDPPIYDPTTLYTPGIQVYSPENPRHENTATSVEQTYKIRFSETIQTSTSRRRKRSLIDELDMSDAENAFATSFNNLLVDLANSSYIVTVTATQNDVNTTVEFRISSRDGTVAVEAERQVELRFVNTTAEPFIFDGRSFTIEDADCFLEIGGFCKSTSSVTTSDDSGDDSGTSVVITLKIWQLVLIIVGAILAI